jgi:hypothetical protein
MAALAAEAERRIQLGAYPNTSALVTEAVCSAFKS